MRLSKRVQQLAPSLTLAISAKAKELKLNGEDIISLSVGEPDFNTPDHILEAATKAMDLGLTRYTPSDGIPELRQAIAAKLEQDQGLTYSDKEITVTIGAKHALYNAFQAILNPGDEVIVPAPYWVSYIEQIKLADGVPVIINGEEKNDFKVTPLQIEAAITPKTKAILINSPSNPTGMVYESDNLQSIGAVCLKHHLWIISDEIYEHFIYDEHQHVSIASISEDLKKRTILINGVSKAYAMTGWRIGYAAGPQDVIQAMTSVASHSTSNATSIAQYAAIAAIEGTQEPLAQMKKAFSERRDYVVKQINEMPGVSCLKPTGAFYVFVNIRESMKQKGVTAAKWAQQLLAEEKVAVVPGESFGADNYVRISYAASMEQLEQGMEGISKFVCKI